MMQGITVVAPEVTQGKSVTLSVINHSGAALGGPKQPVSIALTLPLAYVADEIAAQRATANVRLDGSGHPVSVADGSGSWQVMTHPLDSSEAVMRVDVRNDLGAADGSVPDGGMLHVTLPLKPGATAAAPDVNYIVESTRKVHHRPKVTQLAAGSVTLKIAAAGKPAGASTPPPPKVVFRSDAADPLSLSPKDPVTLSWQVEKGAISAKLMGALPGGNELALGDAATSGYPLEKGHITVRVTGKQVYLLQVQYPDKPVVTRMVTLDVSSADEFGSVSLSPTSVLPNGYMEANWTAWGVKAAELDIQFSGSGNNIGHPLALTNSGKDPAFNSGSGSYGFVLPGSEKPQVTLNLTAWPEHDNALPKSLPGINARSRIDVRAWKDWTTQFVDASGAATATPQLKRLLYAASRLIAITAGGKLFFSLEQMDSDPLPDSTTLRAFSPASGETWLDVAVLQDEIVALRRVGSHNDVEVARLQISGDGKNSQVAVVGTPSTLPAAYRNCPTVNLMALGERVYVVGEPHGAHNEVPIPVSLKPDASSSMTKEPYLMAAFWGQTATLGDALYVLHLDRGELIQFRADAKQPEGTLAPPLLAAAKGPKPQVKAGVLAAVEDVLVILGDADSQAEIAITPHDKRKKPQDWVYNPQTDGWSHCGHGLDLAQGAVALRAGDQIAKRLFAIGSGKPGDAPVAKTLLVGNQVDELFARDHFSGNKNRYPTQPYFDKQLVIQAGTKVDAASLKIPAASLAVTGLDSALPTLHFSSKSVPQGVLFLPNFATSATVKQQAVYPISAPTIDGGRASFNAMVRSHDERKLFLQTSLYVLPFDVASQKSMHLWKDGHGFGGGTELHLRQRDSVAFAASFRGRAMRLDVSGERIVWDETMLEGGYFAGPYAFTEDGDRMYSCQYNNQRWRTLVRGWDVAAKPQLIWSGGAPGDGDPAQVDINFEAPPGQMNTIPYPIITGLHLNRAESRLCAIHRQNATAYVFAVDAKTINSNPSTIKLDGEPGMTRVCHVSDAVYVADFSRPGQALKIDLATNSVVGQSPVKSEPNKTQVYENYLALSPDGRWLFVASRSQQKLWVYDAVAWRLLGQPISIGVTPVALEVAAGKLYILDDDSKLHAYEIELSTQAQALELAPTGDARGLKASLASVPEIKQLSMAVTADGQITISFQVSPEPAAKGDQAIDAGQAALLTWVAYDGVTEGQLAQLNNASPADQRSGRIKLAPEAGQKLVPSVIELKASNSVGRDAKQCKIQWPPAPQLQVSSTWSNENQASTLAYQVFPTPAFMKKHSPDGSAGSLRVRLVEGSGMDFYGRPLPDSKGIDLPFDDLGKGTYTVTSQMAHDRFERFCTLIVSNETGTATHRFDNAFGMLKSRG